MSRTPKQRLARAIRAQKHRRRALYANSPAGPVTGDYLKAVAGQYFHSHWQACNNLEKAQARGAPS